METRAVKVGIMSFAHMHAHSYAACIKAMKGIELVGISDEDRVRGGKVAQQYETKYFSQHGDLLKTEIEAVVVTSENVRHHEMTLAAAKAGKHVLCEKPIAATCEEALSMIRSCRKEGIKLQTAFPVRFATPVARAKELIDSGTIGDVRAINGTNRGKMPGGWFIQRSLSGGGAVIDHTVHVVDLMRWFLRSEVKTVYAQVDTRFYDIDVDDCGTLFMEFENGVFATLDPSWSRPRSFPTWGDVTMEIVGDRGTIFVDAFRQSIEIYQNTPQSHLLNYWGDNMDMEMIKHFVDCVREGEDPSVTGLDGLRTLEVALAAYESAHGGRVVALQRNEV